MNPHRKKFLLLAFLKNEISKITELFRRIVTLFRKFAVDFLSD